MSTPQNEAPRQCSRGPTGLTPDINLEPEVRPRAWEWQFFDLTWDHPRRAPARGYRLKLIPDGEFSRLLAEQDARSIELVPPMESMNDKSKEEGTR